jgi:hypothetical protein
MVDRMGSIFNEALSSRLIALIDNFYSIIKQIRDIKSYIGYAKPKDEKVVDNNYAFETGISQIRFRTLDDLDPQHFSIGAETNCCQRIGGAGQGAAVDSYINPLAGVILLEVNDGSGWKLAAQSYFHYVPSLNYIILDNIEAGTTNFNIKTFKLISGISFRDAYGLLGKTLLEKGYNRVLCGMDHTHIINSNDFEVISIDEDPRNFEIEEEGIGNLYTDFEEEGSYDLGKPRFEFPNLKNIKFPKPITNNLMVKISNMALKSLAKDSRLKKLSSCLSMFNLTEDSNRVLLLGKNLK